MNLNEWIVIPGDNALRSAVQKADESSNPTVLDYQRDKLNAALSLVKNFNGAIDAGANYGIMSYRLNEKFSKVYAFEIEPEVRECLKKNVEKFNLNNVIVYDYGLSDKEESVSLNYLKNTFGTYVNRNVPGTHPCRPIDTLELSNIDFFKIDCEGYEPFILKGAEDTIKKCKPVILMEEKNYSKKYYGTEGNLAVDLLLSWGYKIAYQWPKDCVMVWSE